MTLVRATFHISSVANGEDAVSYEIVPSTRSLLIDADGNWVIGTTTSGRYAKVICSVYKVTGPKRELCTEKLWYSASNVIAKKGSFDGGSFHLMIPSSTNVVDVSIFASNETASGPTGSSLAIISIPVIHNGTDGTAGASLLCQYSADKTNWHDGFTAGDVWMRQKLSTDTTWSGPMRIVGERGTNGSYTEYSYGISEKESVASSANSPGVESWYDMPIPTTKDKPYLWMRVIKVDEKGNESSPAYTRINGKDGNNGTSVNIKGSKPSSSALPSSGQKMGDCYLINGELWVYTGETGSGIVNGFVNCGNIKGEPGDSAVQYFYHIAWATEIKTDSSGTMTGVEGFTTSNPAGLSYAYMGVCYNTVSSPDPSDWSQYKWVKVEGKDAVTYEVKLDTNTVSADGKTGKFLTTKLGKYRLLRHTGDKTENCSGVLDTFDFLIFLIGADGEVLDSGVLTGDTNSDIYGTITGNGLKEEDVYQMKFFWYSAPTVVANRYNYLKELKKTQGSPTSVMPFSVLASNTFTILRQGVDGERGSSGAVWRQHRDFVEASETATYKYEAGGNDEKFIDAVLLVGTSGKKTWYRCIQSYYSTGKSDSRNIVGSDQFAKYWDSAYMTVDFIATDFFLSENAKINLLGSNEINLTDSTTGDIFGSYRIPSGNGDDNKYALWLGATTGAGAPFSVTKSGEIYSVSGTIGGFVIGKNALGSSQGSNMFLTNDYIHFGNFAALTNFDGYCIELGRRNQRCLTAVSSSSSDNDIYVGGFFSVLVNRPIASFAAALHLQCDWTADAGEIDMTKALEGNHAILIESGDVAGIRPSFVRINKDMALSDYNFNVECYNETSAITLTLPASPKWGQHYVFIQRGNGHVNFKSALNTNIHDLNSGANGKTWYSGTLGQVTWFWYDGTEWMVRYVNR
jgi:hypothetical protein